MPIGRMAVLISQYIRGKHVPGYETNNYKNGQKCIVVNAGTPLFTGRKKSQKLYRHHTGYPGGLKEYSFKHILEKNPERIMTDAVMGMLPKNSLRKQMIKDNLEIILGPWHNYGNILP
jgi:large subunit ribosomal protein L13